MYCGVAVGASETRFVSTVAQRVRNERRGGELRSSCHEHADEHEIRGGKFDPYLCRLASKDIRLSYHGDDFVILEEENDLQWFAKGLNEALIGIVSC